jgi:hypothetical protein
MSTWKVGRPVDVEAYDQMFSPESDTLNVSTKMGALSHVAVANVGVVPLWRDRPADV